MKLVVGSGVFVKLFFLCWGCNGCYYLFNDCLSIDILMFGTLLLLPWWLTVAWLAVYITLTMFNLYCFWLVLLFNLSFLPVVLSLLFGIPLEDALRELRIFASVICCLAWPAFREALPDPKKSRSLIFFSKALEFPMTFEDWQPEEIPLDFLLSPCTCLLLLREGLKFFKFALFYIMKFLLCNLFSDCYILA